MIKKLNNKYSFFLLFTLHLNSLDAQSLDYKTKHSQIYNFEKFGEVQYNYECPDSKKIRTDDKSYKLIYNSIEVHSNVANSVMNLPKEERFNFVVSESKKILSILREFEANNLNKDDPIYNHDRMMIIDMLLDLNFDFASIFFFDSYYDNNVFREVSEFDLELIKLAEEIFYDLEKEEGIYKFDNVLNTNSIIYEYLLIISEYLTDFYYYTKFNMRSDPNEEDKTYYWYKKRFEIYQKIFSHSKEDFLVRHIGLLEKPCTPLSQAWDEYESKNYNTSQTNEEIRNYYPVGHFELDYIAFLSNYNNYDMENSAIHMREVLISLGEVLTDLEFLFSDNSSFGTPSTFNNTFGIYNAPISSEEQLLQAYMIGLDIVAEYESISQMKSLNRNIILAMFEDINEKINEDTVFDLAEQRDVRYGFNYIEYYLDSMDALKKIPNDDKLKFYLDKIDFLLKKGIKDINEKKVSESMKKYYEIYAERAKSQINENYGTGDFQKKLIDLAQNIYENNPSERKIKKMVNKTFKNLKYESLSKEEKFHLIGLFSAISIDDTNLTVITNELLSIMSETPETLVAKSEKVFNELYNDTVIESAKPSARIMLIEMDIMLLRFYRAVLGENSEEYLVKYFERVNYIFGNISVKDIQENLHIAPTITNLSKEVLQFYRTSSLSEISTSNDKAMMNYIHDSFLFYLIDQLRNLPVEKDNLQKLDQYLYRSSVIEFVLDDNLDFYFDFNSNLYDKMKDDEVIIFYDSHSDSILDMYYDSEEEITFLKIHMFIKNEEGSLSRKTFRLYNRDKDEREEIVNNTNLLNNYFELDIEDKNILSKKLYEYFIINDSEIETIINNAKYLTIIKDPIYTKNLAFEALTPNDGIPLLYNFESINYANSLRDYIQKKPRRVNMLTNKALIFGNVDYSINKSPFENLEWTKNEIDNISNMFFRSSVFQQKTATETNFKSNIKNSKIIHLALHGINEEENFKESALIFASDDTNDGLLDFVEISNLNLENVNLVVLSACDTNKGQSFQGYGNLSLQRAFKNAGVSNIVSTLWSIDDKITYYFMIEYYNELKKLGNSSLALNNAKKIFINKYPEYNSPHYWAAFVHYGTN